MTISSARPRVTHTRRRMVFAGLACAGFACVAVEPARAAAARIDVPDPGPKDTCPVCGMFVAPYPYWIATVLYQDGHADHFDGAKDMFKYLFDMPKYAGGRVREQIKAIGVTDYYATERIDARRAIYVVGSDTLGPMGHELVPLATSADADEFAKDHAGKRKLVFDEVTQALAFALDDGRFE